MGTPEDVAAEKHFTPPTFWEQLDEAKKLVATDIGETLCVLAGNLMMEDEKAGSLFAHQLQPIIDYIKTKYLPDLPRLATVKTIVSQQVDEAEQRGIRKIIERIEADKDLVMLIACYLGEEWQAFLKGVEK
jgi:hypothetical protein